MMTPSDEACTADGVSGEGGEFSGRDHLADVQRERELFGGSEPLSPEAAARIYGGQQRDLEREVARLRSAIWAYFTLGPERRAQAESILRSALPDDYKPVGG